MAHTDSASKGTSARSMRMSEPLTLITAHFFAALLGADITGAHPHLEAWRRRVSARRPVQQALSSMSDFLRSRGLEPPAFCQPSTMAGGSARRPEAE